jgi:hypothetical protein
MNDGFQSLVVGLEPKVRDLVASSPCYYADLPPSLPHRGVYLFSEATEHLYVGRTNSLRARLAAHCRPGSDHRKAAFAFRLAREATGNTRPICALAGSRNALATDPHFADAFMAAKSRIARMSIRYVEESDPVAQALLEIYVAVVLKAKYNDFDNH